MNQTDIRPWSVGLRLFGLSFTALFLELMVIRWVPSEVRLVAYYANLMLVSSFLGLGIGAMVASRGWNLFQYFAPLLGAYILFLLFPSLLQGLGLAKAAQGFLPVGSGEWRFDESENRGYTYLFLSLIFILNAVAFVPIGEEIGKQFHRLPTLRAYSWDLGGSLAGTLFFGAFSLLRFSPILGMTMVAILMLVLSNWKQRVWGLPCYVVALGAILLVGDRGAYWSPYYFITVHEQRVVLNATPLGTEAKLEKAKASEPPANLRTMQDPPVFNVSVNQDFYQLHGSVDPARYSESNLISRLINSLFNQYCVPYFLSQKHDRVLVLGSGGGMDVQTALLQNAKRVDAVEIDPVIPRISNRYSAAAVYSNPLYKDRVFLHIDDARSFLQNTRETYDLVVFGFLDSQALFSYGASLRLDGYTYTVESFRKAYERVVEGGAMSVSFFVGKPWMRQKLEQMIEAATGRAPFTYMEGDKAVMVVTKHQPEFIPASVGSWHFTRMEKQTVDLATDDWPYLYLEKKSVPIDYAVVIGILIMVSIVAVTALRGTSFGATDAHFLFMGWGFLLLQTKSIGDCSLYFGTTWFVTTVVITGVLLMVLLANWVAIKWITSFNPLLYIPLFCSLGLLLFVPRELILGQNYGVRLAWSILIVPLPIFFAGLIFSTTFKDAANPSALFGSNLMGATIGGFCEYLSMWIGSEALSYIVIAAYLASLTCILLSRKKGLPGTPAIPAPAPA